VSNAGLSCGVIGGPSGTAMCERRLNLGMSRIAFCAKITSLVTIICFIRESQATQV
jgi:hypothetical protein